MKKLYLLLLLFEFSNSQPITWTQKADFPTNGRAWAVSFSIGDKGYVGTGGQNSIYHNDLWEYNPVNDTWTQKANLPAQSRTGAIGVSTSTKGYIGLGSVSQLYNDFWEYDPNTNMWTQKSNFPGSGRKHATSFSINDKIYVGTGGSQSTIGNETNEFWEYDPASDSWIQKADFPGIGRSRAVGFSIAGKGYIGPGYHFDSQNPVWPKDMWEYNPSNDLWTKKPNYPGSGNTDCVHFSIGNFGYVGMGYLNNLDFWKFDPQNNSWTPLTSFPGNSRIAQTSCAIGNKGYLGLGYKVISGTSIYFTDFWEMCDSALSIDENTINTSDIVIYPNPIKDNINFRINDPSIQIELVKIYDINGRLIHQYKNSEQLSINNISSGNYFLKISINKGTLTKKIIKI